MASHPDRKLVATGQVASALDGTADCPFLHVWDTTSSPFESLQRIDFPAERDASSRCAGHAVQFELVSKPMMHQCSA